MTDLLGTLTPCESSANVIPHVLRAFHYALHRHRFDLFVQPASSRIPHDTYTNNKVRHAVRQALFSCQQALSPLAEKAPILYWQQKQACWNSVASWGVYLATEEEWAGLLSADATEARLVMANHRDVQLLEPVLGVLGTMERLDHNNTQIDAIVVSWCIAVRSGPDLPPWSHDSG